MARIVGMLCVVLACVACGGRAAPPDPFPVTPLTTELTRLRDGQGRYVFLNGINTSGGDKVPASIDASGVPSYVGKPFPLDQAARHFDTLRSMGFNSIRLLILWEGLQPTGPDTIDRDYVDYLYGIVKTANDYGIRVLLEMHQDVFSRHLFARYNQHPTLGAPGSLENTLLALVGPYDDVVAGNGAPRWAVEACLQERDLSSPGWGVPRVVTGLTDADLDALVKAYRTITGSGDGAPSAEWVAYFKSHLPGTSPVNGTSDMLPFSPWGIAHALSLDVARCYACFFVGKTVFPTLTRGGKNVQDYLQDAFIEAWRALAARMKDLPNVLGYDVFNEPSGNYLVLSAVAAAVKAGAIGGAKTFLDGLLGPITGDQVYDLLVGFRVLPPDTKAETLHSWGLDSMDPMAALGLNVGFDENHLRPFDERVGAAIQGEDPDAFIFIEGSIGPGLLLGSLGGAAGGMWEVPMTAPVLPVPDHVVFAPHWYPDMYPFPSFVRTPRSFTAEEIRYRDYTSGIAGVIAPAAHSLGNLPVVFAEFGMFFDFGGIEAARASNYEVTSYLLNNYFEALEGMFLSRMMWDYCPENDFAQGDLWDHEDLSIIDPQGHWRGQKGWNRPYPRALAGKPVAMHYWSDLHYFDPEKGQVTPYGEFLVTYSGKVTAAPTEIFVPTTQYPDGFLVWVSDGFCEYDPTLQVLYHHPEVDEPEAEHSITVRRPLPGGDAAGWRYFFRGDRVIAR